MPYCPACGSEYQEGTEQCVDCKVDLQPGPPPSPVEEAQASPQPDLVRVRFFSGPQAVMEADLARNILETQAIPCVLRGQYAAEVLPGIDIIQLFVLGKDAERAGDILQAYFNSTQASD